MTHLDLQAGQRPRTLGPSQRSSSDRFKDVAEYGNTQVQGGASAIGSVAYASVVAYQPPVRGSTLETCHIWLSHVFLCSWLSHQLLYMVDPFCSQFLDIRHH